MTTRRVFREMEQQPITDISQTQLCLEYYPESTQICWLDLPVTDEGSIRTYQHARRMGEDRVCLVETTC